MKRIYIMILFLSTWVSLFAGDPLAPLKQIFDGRYSDKAEVEIYETRQKGNYYKCINVEGNSVIVRQLWKIVNDCEKGADLINMTQKDGERQIVMQFQGCTVNVGVIYLLNGSRIRIWMQSSSPLGYERKDPMPYENVDFSPKAVVDTVYLPKFVVENKRSYEKDRLGRWHGSGIDDALLSGDSSRGT